MYTETQLLLLVGDVAADRARQRHGDGADNSRDGAHLGRRLCGRAPSRGANRCAKWKETKKQNPLTVVVVILVDLVVVAARVTPYGKKRSGLFLF